MTLLDIRGLDVSYPRRGALGKPFAALSAVSLDVQAGETVGIVGESGSGKTTLGRAVLGLVPVAAGEIRYRGNQIQALSRIERAREIQVVFQDPYSSLNPTMPIERILCEPLVVRKVPREAARRKVRSLLDRVGLPANAADRLPREFSGGQRQRIAIARALAVDPSLIICDEPVSALDLSTQKRVLDLFIEIQESSGVAYLFISHDLSVIRYLCHRVAVLHRGEVVEFGDAGKVTSAPEHPYTHRLLMAAPLPDPDRQAERRAQRALLAETVQSGQ